MDPTAAAQLAARVRSHSPTLLACTVAHGREFGIVVTTPPGHRYAVISAPALVAALDSTSRS